MNAPYFGAGGVGPVPWHVPYMSPTVSTQSAGALIVTHSQHPNYVLATSVAAMVTQAISLISTLCSAVAPVHAPPTVTLPNPITPAPPSGSPNHNPINNNAAPRVRSPVPYHHLRTYYH